MSNNPTPEQMNEVIAVFDGKVKHDDGKYAYPYFTDENSKGFYYPFQLEYHSSWDWLMPVVRKIEQIENGRFGFTVDPWEVVIIDYGGCYDGKREVEIVSIHREREPDDKHEVLLRDYYEAVTKFFEWYNKQKEVNNE